MWISKGKYAQLIKQIEKCEMRIREQEQRMNEKVRVMTKRILMEPAALYEEFKGEEHIEKMIDDFINS